MNNKINITELKRIGANRFEAAANLYNYGLTMRYCDVAYLAALRVGASPADAFEAAREYMLIEMIPRDVSAGQVIKVERPGSVTYDHIAGRGRYTQADYDNRIAEMQRVANLPNPFRT